MIMGTQRSRILAGRFQQHRQGIARAGTTPSGRLPPLVARDGKPGVGQVTPQAQDLQRNPNRHPMQAEQPVNAPAGASK
jgi:hypothetical protein